jgi:hypothetical protein
MADDTVALDPKRPVIALSLSVVEVVVGVPV